MKEYRKNLFFLLLFFVFSLKRNEYGFSFARSLQKLNKNEKKRNNLERKNVVKRSDMYVPVWACSTQIEFIVPIENASTDL